MLLISALILLASPTGSQVSESLDSWAETWSEESGQVLIEPLPEEDFYVVDDAVPPL